MLTQFQAALVMRRLVRGWKESHDEPENHFAPYRRVEQGSDALFGGAG